MRPQSCGGRDDRRFPGRRRGGYGLRDDCGGGSALSLTEEGWYLRCIDCAAKYTSDPPSYRCTQCGAGLLEALRDAGLRDGTLERATLFGRRGEQGIWRFRALLPVSTGTRPVSLAEGGTPLLRTSNVASELGLRNLYVKNEGQNPTGSFKDRGMTVAVTRAVAGGARGLVCASTGNTSASMSAYAARAGVGSAIIVPVGKVAVGKLVQAVAFGARVVRSAGTFDDALELLLRASSNFRGFCIMNSINPYRIEGQKTIAFEVFEQLGFKIPDYVVLPVGNAGNISAIWKGFVELKESGISDALPRMVGVQAEGAAPIARAFWRGAEEIEPLDNPHTVASAIRIGRPASAKKALTALRESRGMVVTVTDAQIVQARRLLASKEGVFVEPASAAPLAAMREVGGRFERDATIVCVATGNGLKDQESVEMNADDWTEVSDSDALSELLRASLGD